MIISEMQSKLATWSTEDKERKFDRLLRLVADKAWLSEAAHITLSSSGARTPGVDGVDKRMMEAHLHDELATIRDELLSGSYSPMPARRVLAVAVGRVRHAVARHAALADLALAVGAALHVHDVRVAVVALQRAITARMAVLAARMLQHAAHRLERHKALLPRR